MQVDEDRALVDMQYALKCAQMVNFKCNKRTFNEDKMFRDALNLLDGRTVSFTYAFPRCSNMSVVRRLRAAAVNVEGSKIRRERGREQNADVNFLEDDSAPVIFLEDGICLFNSDSSLSDSSLSDSSFSDSSFSDSSFSDSSLSQFP